jgi:hypothetical protein
MPTFTATDYEPVPPGLYTARLEEIKEAQSQYGTYYPWVFIIEDEGEFEGRRVRANVTDKFGREGVESLDNRPGLPRYRRADAISKGAADKAWSMRYEIVEALTWDHKRQAWTSGDGFAYDVLLTSAVGGGGGT